MMFLRKLVLSTVLCSVGLAPTAQALETWGAAKFIGEFNAAYTGFEVAVPYFQMIDDNMDGYPEKALARFNIFSLGTPTKRYNTLARYIDTPSIDGCSNPSEAANTLDITKTWVGRATTSTRLTLVMQLEYTCNGETESRVVVYSAKVDTAGGASWKFVSPRNFWLDAADGIDKNNDGSNENLALMMSYDSTNGAEMRVIEFKFSDGSQVSNRTYPFTR